MASPSPITRTEVICITVLTLVAASLRWGDLNAFHVEHFDEGVYASDIWFGPENGDHYPFQHLYAPPLFPWLTEWSITAFGPTPLGCMFWSLLFGTATVPLVWWAARRWFGPLAAMVTTILASMSEFHAVYSRAALTDATLVFWLIAAVWLAWEAMERQSWRWANAAGLGTAVAWWTKYNGWLPLAISLAGLSGAAVFSPASRSLFLPRLKLWAVVCVVAVVAWSPVWLGLQDVGGYAAVAENHRGYLVGFEGWLDSVVRQEAAHRNMENWGVKFETALWFILVALLLRFTWNASETSGMPSGEAAWGVAICCAAFGAVAGRGSTSIAIAVAGGAGLVVGAVRMRRADTEQDNSSLGFWFTAAWFVGLSLVTPLYHPYPRLTLPWLASGWLLTGATLSAVGSWRGLCPSRRQVRWVVIATIAASTIMIRQPSQRAKDGAVTESPRDNGYGASRDNRRAALEIAQTIITECRENAGTDQFVILLHGHPGIFFHLRSQHPHVYPVAGVEGVRAAPKTPTFVLTDGTHPPASRLVTVSSRPQSMLVQSNSVNLADFDSNRATRIAAYRLTEN